MLSIPEFPDRSVSRTLTCPDTGVKYDIIDRSDVIADAPAYFFHFQRRDTPKEGEYTSFIISHESVEDAIEWFGAKHYRFDAYANAEFVIERIGVDFLPYRTDTMLLGYQ